MAKTPQQAFEELVAARAELFAAERRLDQQKEAENALAWQRAEAERRYRRAREEMELLAAEMAGAKAGV